MRILELHQQRAQEWAALDHASGDVVLPEWAHTFFGAGHEAGSKEAYRSDPVPNAVAQELKPLSPGVVSGNTTGRNLLQTYNPPDVCETGVTEFEIPVGSMCTVTYGLKYFGKVW